ncbi:MAG: dihydroorotate dehydrogenase B catalytic subunit [Deltaproteobacteria bacterium RBG_13_52_11]|nr:MAG: dihydroorotate dehydrogenase B catalytic subunit [Deltaproteobacteria bacterium RBG_13_52_11]
MPNLKVKLGRLELQNPVMPASGTFGYGEEYASLIDLNKLGAIVTKGVSLAPQEGNPPPRIRETRGGMLNSIGLQNVGLEAFAQQKLPFLHRFKVPIIVNFFGFTIDEYAEVAMRLSALEGVAALEANLSCPNIKAGGIYFGVGSRSVAQITKKLVKSTNLAIIIKLSSQVSNIKEICLAAEGEGAEAVTLINSIPAMAIDLDRKRPVLGGVTGGLSGPAIKPIALKAVWEAASAVKIPIVGVGGIMDYRDALEFLVAGAMAVQVGTANFINPTTMVEIIDGIDAFLTQRGIENIREIIGSLKL